MIKCEAALLKHRVQALGLCNGTRKAVKDHAIGAVRAVHALGNHAENDLVRHEVAAIHDFLGAKAELGFGVDRGTKHVAGRQLHQSARLDKTLGLRALAGTGGSEQDDVHRLRPFSFDFFTRPSYWCARRCDWIWPTVSSVTVTTIRSDVPPR